MPLAPTAEFDVNPTDDSTAFGILELGIPLGNQHFLLVPSLLVRSKLFRGTGRFHVGLPSLVGGLISTGSDLVG